MQARQGAIDINELTLPVQLESERAYAEFQSKWDEACKAGNPKLLRVLWKTFGKVRAGCHSYKPVPSAAAIRIGMFGRNSMQSRAGLWLRTQDVLLATTAG